MSSSIISGDSSINTDESTSGNINSYDDGDSGNNSNKATTKQIIPPPPPIYSSSENNNKSSSISSSSISISSSQKSSMINTICCTIHPSIQLKRRRRRRTTATTNNKTINSSNIEGNDDKSSNDDNEECWIQLIKECPLCTADDDDSVWSGRTTGSYLSRSSKSSRSSSSNKTLQSSPKSSSNDKKVYNSAPVNTPSPPPTAPRQLLRRLSTTTTTTNNTNSNNKEYIPSKFKESKDNGEYDIDNEEGLSQIEQPSSKSKEYSNQDNTSQQDNNMEEEDNINLNFPSLPFTDQDHHHDTTIATTSTTATINNIKERTSSIKQMIQCRKLKLEELKLRTTNSNKSSRGSSKLTPPSQRYMNSKLSIEEDSLGEDQEQVVLVDSSVKSSQRSLHSESTKCISNSVTVRKDHASAKYTNVDTTNDNDTKPASSNNNSNNNNMLETSFYSNVSHSCGSPQKDKLALTVMPNIQQEVVSNQKKLSRCHSDSTLSSTVVSTVKQRDDHQQQQQQQQQSYYNKSILDISYDSFVDESVRQFFNYHTSSSNDECSASSIVKEDGSSDMKEEEKDNTATKEEEQVSCITLDVSNRSSDKEKNDHIDTTTTLKQQQVDSKKKSQQQSQPHSQQKHKVKRKAKNRDDLLNTATYDIWGSNSSNNCVEVPQATTVTTTTDDVAADDNKELIQLSNKLYSLVYPRRTNTMENKNPRHPSVKQDNSSKKSMSNKVNDVNNDLQSMNIEEEVDVSMNVSPTLSSIHDNNMRKEDADDDSYENENDGYSISEESLLGEEPPGYTSVNNKLKKYDAYTNNEVSSSSYTQDDPPGDNMSTDSDYYYTRSSPGVSTTSSSDSYSLGFDDYANNKKRGGVSHYSMECSSDESRSSRSSHVDDRRRERSRDNHPNNPSILRNSISSKSRTFSTSKETSRTDRETTSRRSNSTKSSSIAKSKSSSKGSGSSTVVTQESVKTFCQYDARTGRCIHHPHIQLRRKRRLGGFKKGQWKIISMNCTECAFEEVQRLRARALKKQQQLKPCSSSVGQKSQYTSATESSSRYTSSDDSTSQRDNRIPKGILKKHPSGYHYIDDSSTANGSSISLPSISETQSYSTASYTYPPRGILRKPNKHVVYDNESSFLSSSTELSGLSESCYSDSTGSSSCVSSGESVYLNIQFFVCI